MKYSHAYDFAVEIESNDEFAGDITHKQVIQAFRERLDKLEAELDSMPKYKQGVWREIFDCYDTTEV